MRPAAFALVALAFVSTTAQAQFPTPPVEELKAVPPKPARLHDGHPNWTGFWVTPAGFLEVYRGPSGLGGGPPPGGGAPNTRRPPPGGGGPELKSPYNEQYAETQRKNAAGELPDMLALCYPPGMPRMMGMIYGMEILQTPTIISITSEFQAATRRIGMDVKAHPPAEELDPTYAGHSIGHWEGDTLVVDTVGVRDDVPIDFALMPHSPKMRIVERISQPKPGILTDELTIIDPDVTDMLRKQTYTYRYRPELKLQEYTCLENNRNVDPSTGRAEFKK